ncbi:hypothetical protein D3C80_1417520 [compost metagenome]
MSRQGVVRHHLFGDLAGQIGRQATLLVDGGQLAMLGLGIGGQFGGLAGDVGLFGIGLGTDRDVLARGHRHGPGDQSGHARDQDGGLGRARRRHADDQAGGRDDAVVGAQHRRAHPADPADQMGFVVNRAAHAVASLTIA